MQKFSLHTSIDFIRFINGRKVVWFILLLLLACNAFSQNHGGRANWWYFGDSLNLNFNGGGPNQVNNSLKYTVSSPVSMSDKNGNLLFYGNRDVLYDASGNVMQNGQLFMNTGLNDSPNFTLALPVPCSDSLYYFFQVRWDSLIYSVIDMSLNNGLGAVVPGQEDIKVPGSDSVAFTLTATKHSNNRDYWIVSRTRKKDISRWYAWLLTPNGLNPVPVTSDEGVPFAFEGGYFTRYGQIRFSPSGTKLAHANKRGVSGAQQTGINGVQCGFYNNLGHPECGDTNFFFVYELLDFDRTTGQFSNALALEFDSSFYDWQHPDGRVPEIYSVEFSPNEEVLYVTSWSWIIQYDLSSGNPAVIPSAWNQLFVDPWPGYRTSFHLQRGADDRLYLADGSGPPGPFSYSHPWYYSHISVVENPNVFGAGANFNFQAINTPRSTMRGFPNFTHDQLTIRKIERDSGVFCTNDTLELNLNNIHYLDSVQWHFPGQQAVTTDTSQLPFEKVLNDTGTVPYFAVAHSGCDADTLYDTLNIHRSPEVDLGADTTLCYGDSLFALDPDTSLSFLWSTSETAHGISVTNTGTYSVTVSSTFCGTDADTVNVDSLIQVEANLPADTFVCSGDSLILDAFFSEASYQWNTGDTTNEIAVSDSGMYQVTVNHQCGTDSDSVFIEEEIPPAINLGNDTLICDGQTVVLDATFSRGDYLWHDNSTGAVFSATEQGLHFVEVTNPCGTASDSIFIEVDSVLNVDLGGDSVLCLGDTYRLESNVPADVYTWNTGANTPFIIVDSAGIYSLVVSNTCGTFGDTVTIDYDRTPITDLGPDSTYCITYLKTLDASWSRATYLWNTGETDSAITAGSSGTYWVEVVNLCGFDEDTVRIHYHDTLHLNLRDTNICPGETVILDPRGHGATYVWQDGSTSPTFEVTEPGSYSVTANNRCGSKFAQVDVEMYDLPTGFYPDDALFCDDESYEVKITGEKFSSLIWADGYSGSERKITQTGRYEVILGNHCGSDTGSFTVRFVPAPLVELNDTILCEDSEEIVVGVPLTGVSWDWSEGSIDSAIHISRPGQYAVTVIDDSAGCITEETFEITRCDVRLFIPNAFTPNDDGLNDVFSIEGQDLDRFWIRIFDRWGRELFFSDNPDFSWDGTYRGQPVNQGIYTYKVWYRKGDYESDEVMGTVSVLR